MGAMERWLADLGALFNRPPPAERTLTQLGARFGGGALAHDPFNIGASEMSDKPWDTKMGRVASHIGHGIRNFVETPARIADALNRVERGEIPEQFTDARDPWEAARQQVRKEVADAGAEMAVEMIGMGRLPGAAPSGAVVGTSGSKLVRPE